MSESNKGQLSLTGGRGGLPGSFAFSFGDRLKPYWQQLQSPQWQKKRLEVMERAKFQCEECGTQDSQLHVHHRIYQKGKAPWEYPDAYLACLCSDCHAGAHELRDSINILLAELTPKEILEVGEFALRLLQAKNAR